MGMFKKKERTENAIQAMKQILIKTVIIISAFGCYSCMKTDKKKEVFFGENQYQNFLNDSLSESLKMYSDSTFVLTRKFKTNDYEKIENLKGRFYIKSDSIYFGKNLLSDIKSQRGIIKDNYLEIIDDEACYKIKVVKTGLPNRITYDSYKFKDFALFSLNKTRDSLKIKDATPYDLNDQELSNLDSLLRSCMTKDPQLKNRRSDNYYKQCIATKSLNNEVIVWISCICHESGFTGNEIQRQVINGVKDGGTCYFQLKINLTKRSCFDLLIHGDA